MCEVTPNAHLGAAEESRIPFAIVAALGLNLAPEPEKARQSLRGIPMHDIFIQEGSLAVTVVPTGKTRSYCGESNHL